MSLKIFLRNVPLSPCQDTLVQCGVTSEGRGDSGADQGRMWRRVLGCVGFSGRRGSGPLSGCTAGAVETGQYFSGTASDKLGHLQYFLSKLGYPSRCCGHPRALGSWVTQKWSSPCPAPSGIPAPIPRPWQQSLGGSGFPAPNGTKPIRAGSLSQTIRERGFSAGKKTHKRQNSEGKCQ